MTRSTLALALLLSPVLAHADTIYNNIQSPLPPGIPSLGFQATQTAQFGDMVTMAGTNRLLESATVVMTNWAPESDWETVGTSSGFNIMLTLNIFAVGAGDTVGALIGTSTINAFIPWRPETGGGCPIDTYLGFDSNCYHGANSLQTFLFSSLLVPDTFIFGIAYNTQTWGATPTGVAGPYNSLNVGLTQNPPNTGNPSIGSRPLPDTAYWNTCTASNYTDGGAGGTCSFRQDTAWSPYSAAVSFAATPEPATISLLSLGLGGILLAARRRMARK